MKTLLVVLALCSAAFGQWANYAPSCTPDAVTLQESFGDGGVLCWAGGPTSCTNTWTIGGGTAQSIGTTPGSPPLYTACTNSLKMVTVSAANDYIYTALPTTIAAGATADITFTLDVTANAQAAFDVTKLLAPTIDTGGATGPGVMYFKCTAGSCTTTQLYVVGSTTSSTLTITTSAWHTVHLHFASGAAASYFQVDGGTTHTFTENAQAINYIGLGDSGGNLDGMTYYIGNLFVNANSAPNCAYPQVFVPFEASTSGTTSTAALLNASTDFGNGTWTGSVTAITFQSSAQESLITPIDVCGTQYTGSGSLGMQFQIASGTGLAYTYTWTTLSNVASFGMWWQTSIAATDTNFYSTVGLIGGAGGVDYMQGEEQGTGSQLQLHMETSTGNHGTINVSRNTWYWITAQYVAGGTHSLALYNTSGAQVGSTITAAAAGNAAPIIFELGRTGSEAGAPSATYWYDSLKMDYMKGTFPLLP